MAVNPAVALREAIADASERHRSESWPVGYDDALGAWVATGNFGAAPESLHAFASALTPAGFDRLVDLRWRSGGWWVWDATLEQKV